MKCVGVVNQRCGYGGNDGSGEYGYASLDVLYKTESVDGVLLERDWDLIEKFERTDFEMQDLW